MWCVCVHQEAISKYVSELKEQGVFAKEVRSAGVAFHSYYMASIAPTLLAALKKVRSSALFQQYATMKLLARLANTFPLTFSVVVLLAYLLFVN